MNDESTSGDYAMTQLSQTDSPETDLVANEFMAFASAASGALLPAQQDISASTGRAALDFTGKKAEGAELNEPGNSLDRNAEEGTEYLLKLIASLESCNTALFSKLAQTQRELAALRNQPAYTLSGTELADHREQSYGWERKLTRAGWRPS